MNLPPPRPDSSKNPGRLFPGARTGCNGIVGIIFGHDYQSKMDTKVIREGNKEETIKTYYGVLCRRCGDVVNEPKP